MSDKKYEADGDEILLNGNYVGVTFNVPGVTAEEVANGLVLAVNVHKPMRDMVEYVMQQDWHEQGCGTNSVIHGFLRSGDCDCDKQGFMEKARQLLAEIAEEQKRVKHQ